MRTSLAIAVSAAILTAGAASAQVVVWDDPADFIDQLLPGYFETDFADIPTGHQPDGYNFGGGGYAAFANSPNGLFNEPGMLSHNTNQDPMTITFSGNVTAFGGHIWATNQLFQPSGTTVNITLADGTTEQITDSSPNSFRGFTSDVPIESITFLSAPWWTVVGHAWMGEVIPEPGGLSVLGLFGIALTRRRR